MRLLLCVLLALIAVCSAEPETENSSNIFGESAEDVAQLQSEVLLAEHDEAMTTDQDQDQAKLDALDALEACVSLRCADLRKEYRKFAQKRISLRNKLDHSRARLSQCPTSTSRCINLKRRILRLMRRYRYFGGKLRWYMKTAMTLAYGPKDQRLNIPKEYLFGKNKAKKVAAKGTKKANTGKWRPPSFRKAVKQNLYQKAFADAKKQARTLGGNRRPNQKRFWQRWFPLKRQRKVRAAAAKRASAPTWWRRFVIRASRPVRGETVATPSRRRSVRRRRTFFPKRFLIKKDLRSKNSKSKKNSKPRRPYWYSKKLAKELFGPSLREIREGKNQRRFKRIAQVKKIKKKPSWLRQLLDRHDAHIRTKRAARKSRRIARRRERRRRVWDKWSRQFNPSRNFRRDDE